MSRAGLWAFVVMLAAWPGAAAYAQGGEGYGRTDTFTSEEVADIGHRFFGATSRGLGDLIERAFKKYGQPNGYVLGEEGSGAIIAGARYGEGVLYTRNVGTRRIYWQGPSLGWDFGGNGARMMILAYNLASINSLFGRYPGVNGSAYVLGGLGMTAMAKDYTILVPITTGVGARIGVNVGYLKFTHKPTWNPF